jgi:hypothetical protein
MMQGNVEGCFYEALLIIQLGLMNALGDQVYFMNFSRMRKERFKELFIFIMQQQSTTF